MHFSVSGKPMLHFQVHVTFSLNIEHVLQDKWREMVVVPFLSFLYTWVLSMPLIKKVSVKTDINRI
jgi:hypothetical protein